MATPAARGGRAHASGQGGCAPVRAGQASHAYDQGGGAREDGAALAGPELALARTGASSQGWGWILRS